MSHITINKNLDLSPLFSKPNQDLNFDDLTRPKKRKAPESTYSIQQQIRDQLYQNQKNREEGQEQDEQPQMEVEPEEQEEPNPEPEEEQNEEEDAEQIEKQRQDCLLQITQYINRVPHLLKGYAAKELTSYFDLSLDKLEKEIGVIELVTVANLNPLNGRRMHNMLWKGAEYALVQGEMMKVNGIAERMKLPEEVKNVQQLLVDVVDLMDIRYFGRKTMPLPLIYLVVTANCVLEYHNQNVEAVEKRGETLVAASEAGKFVPLDLQEEAKAFLKK